MILFFKKKKKGPQKPIHGNVYIYRYYCVPIYTYTGLHDHRLKICKDVSQFDSKGCITGKGSRKRDEKEGDMKRKKKKWSAQNPNICAVIPFIH